MKITIKIDKSIPEDTGDFVVKELTPHLLALIDQLQKPIFHLIVTKDEKKYQIDLTKVVTIYTSDKRTYVSLDNKEEYSTRQTLSVLTEKLPDNFLRISSSEIVNADKISHFEFTFGGKIKIFFISGGFTYSSRSHLKMIKEYFGL